MTYKLFIDDLRAPPDSSWIVARSVASAWVYILTYGLPHEFSFDHDLGDGHDAPELLTLMFDAFCVGSPGFENLKKVKFAVHSANPAGRKNLIGKWDSFLQSAEFGV